jgi:predicted small secreted protein
MKRFTAVMVLIVFTLVLLTGCVNDKAGTGTNSPSATGKTGTASVTASISIGQTGTSATGNASASAQVTATPSQTAVSDTLDSANNQLSDLEQTLNTMDTVTESDLTIPAPVEN